MSLATFIQGSAHDLHAIPDGSVQMIATSPPYYGLRAYAGEQAIEWPAVTYRLNEWVEPTTIAGCDPECQHEWQDGPIRPVGNAPSASSTLTTNNGKGPQPGDKYHHAQAQTANMGAYCSRCGGWRGALGMEPSPVAYIGHLILCLREWRRVLREDGVCFVNLGDSYASGGTGGASDKSRLNGGRGVGPLEKIKQGPAIQRQLADGLKPKDLLGIPWLFAIAARADGWYLRSDIVWAKPNPMPESVTDRPTKAHEYIFLLAKSQRYYWDQEAVKEPQSQSETAINRYKYAPSPSSKRLADPQGKPDAMVGQYLVSSDSTRNIRSVWTIATQPTPFAHFATWPEKLVKPMVKAGSREGDTVLDPFSGSGTTGKVAVRLGRKYIGVDISREYLDDVTAQRFGGGVQMEINL